MLARTDAKSEIRGFLDPALRAPLGMTQWLDVLTKTR
jgi:hypothetical protein